MDNEKIEKFESTFEYKLIYIFRINDEAHKDCLKIGDATLKTNKTYDKFAPMCSELKAAARVRIDEYTVTAGIKYELLYTEIAAYLDMKTNALKAFRDHKVHSVLKRSGIKNVYFDTVRKQNEWFKCDLETAKNAIKAVKENKTALDENKITQGFNPIILRPEQEEAINQTIKQFKVNHHMLWNAKMRFGKTLSALELIKRMKFEKTIIITHRPEVDSGWFDDFGKIFYENDTNYSYGSKNNGKSISELLESNKSFVYFASIQDLRGSSKAGGKFDKNNEIFNVKWDFVITDEAHEGTQTTLGQNVRQLLINENNYELSLSGTPFNLFDQYADENTYTWDYIMEQQAKYEWMRDPERLGDSNPYEELPKLNIFTYQLDRLIPTNIQFEDKAFNFTEFFRTWTGDVSKDGTTMQEESQIGRFVHEDSVKAFLDLLVKKDENTNYPFSIDEYRDFFRHTLWMIPGVDAGKALYDLLTKHPVFGQFKIVNVAGDNDTDYKSEQKALGKLRKAMTEHPEDTRTITLSCGKLTTGVTVPEWTAVLMLSGSYMTDAKTYLQTIFRVQSPGNLNGKIKENCYVFDFAPDRTLRVVYDSVQKMSKKRKPKIEVAKLMGDFLNFCPVISLENVSYMKTFSANELLQEVKRVYAERVVESGFEDRCLYDDFKLRQLTQDDLNKFEDLKGIIGKTKKTKKTTVEINQNYLTEEETQELNQLEEKKKNKEQLSEEDKKKIEELKKIKDKRNAAISILRGISIRIPLLVYGMDIDYSADVTIDEFADKIDDRSWAEFMPQGVTKEVFKDFIEYYDKDIFIKSCRSIRAIAKQADDLEPTERIIKLVELFSKFKNPDKETVLTPWRVVNMHMSQTIGGYCFYNEEYTKEIEKPRYVNIEKVTDDIFNDTGKVLEINSKTGLYPLYVAYTFYRLKTKDKENELTFDEKKEIWNSVVENNVYVICKTDMAKQITRRTLLGYTKGKMNAHAFDDLVNQMKEKQQQLVDKILRPSFWNKGGKEMKFNAVVGNPPYQQEIDNSKRAVPVYHYFYDVSFKISEFVTLISPGRFLFNAGLTPSEWNEKILNDEHFKVAKYFKDSHDVFPTVDIKGGVAITVRNKNEIYGAIKHFASNPVLGSIINKVLAKSTDFMSSIVFSKSTYNLLPQLYLDYPEYKNALTKGNEFIVDASVFSLMPMIFRDEASKKQDDILVYGRLYNKRTSLYISKAYVKQNSNLLSYKAILPGANGSGKLGEKLGVPFIGKPNEIHTQTYMSIGCFDNELEAENVIKYLKTKFLRIMLGTLKVTQNTAKDSWANVPLIDFKNNSYINWNLDIEKIDDQLFNYYNLNESEKEYIKLTAEEM